MSFVYWMPAIAGALHVIEEFLWPGGFSVRFRAYRPENRCSFTPRFAIAVNGVMLLADIMLGWMDRIGRVDFRGGWYSPRFLARTRCCI